MMSIRSSLAMRAIHVGSIVAGPRAFSSTSFRLNLKESSSQSNIDYDRHKQDSLSKQKRGKGHWKPELASDSEEAVKADRAAKAGPEEISRLQERTKKHAEETFRGGTSMGHNL